MLNVLDLFSGIGGFSLGLERTGGFKTVAFCEIDPYCRAVLRKHWPEVPCHDDVRNFAGVECDVICGGFPCQDISIAGQQIGIEGARSGLWAEYARLVGDLRPRYIIVENVAALLGYGLGRVCGDLAALGYDAEWECIPAAFIGAPHQRERIFLIAYPDSVGRTRCVFDYAEYEIPAYEGWRHTENLKSGTQWKHWATTAAEAVDGEISRRDFHRMDDGLRADLVRIEALGNAVVPQIVEIIGRAILEAERGEVV